MKLKKILIILIALCLSVSTLGGCGKDEKKDTSSLNADSEKQVSKKDSEEVMTINWMPQNDQPVDAESPVIKLIEEKVGVKFNFIYIDRNKESEILSLRIASNDIPDVMRVDEKIFRTYIEQGALAEISEEMVKEVAPTLYDNVNKYSFDNAWEYPKEDGKLYGLPALNAGGSYHFIPIWRDDWLKNIGIDKIPETIDEAEEAFYKFINEDPDQNGANDTYALSNTGISVVFGAYGGVPYFSKGGGNKLTWAAEDGTVMLSAIKPGMKDALSRLNKWYMDGLIDPEFISGENKGDYWGKSVSFANGQIGFSCPGLYYHVSPPFNESDMGSTNYQLFTELQPEGSYKEGRPFTGPNGDLGTESWGTYPGVYEVFGEQLNDQPEKMKKILEINELLMTDYDFFSLVANGRKGIDYSVTDQGKVPLIKPEEQAKLGLSTNGIGYLVGNAFDFGKMGSKVYSDYADSHKYTDNYKDAVFVSLPSQSQYMATIYKMVQENYIAFISGERDIEEFDKFVEELNDAGLEQLTIEANEWYR